jgi:hypothetical protein
MLAEVEYLSLGGTTMAVELPAVYAKDGKPARHVTTEAERTAAVFEGFKPHQADEKPADAEPTEAEKAEAQKAQDKANAESAKRPGPTAPKPNTQN